MTDHANIEGGCHCGAITFTLRWPRSAPMIPVRRCGCTFCQKHGGAWTSNPDAGLHIGIDDEHVVSKYRFGTETADFYVCSRCGVAPFVLSDIDGGRYAVVNVNSIADTGDFALDESATDFDGEDTGSRLARRRRNWIADVQFGT